MSLSEEDSCRNNLLLTSVEIVGEAPSLLTVPMSPWRNVPDGTHRGVCFQTAGPPETSILFKVFPSCSNKKLFFGHARGVIVETLILVHWMVCVPQQMNCAPTLVTLALHENPAHQLLRVWHSQTLVSHLISSF